MAWCTYERHIFYGSGSTSAAPLMSERCACGTVRQGDISPIDRLLAENERLRAKQQLLRDWTKALEAWASTVLRIVRTRRVPSADLIEDGDRISAEVRTALQQYR